MRTLFPLSLARRIVANVAIGLALVLIVFSVVAVWTVQEATRSAYAERVALARALVRHVDDILGYSVTTLETAAGSLVLPPGQSISVAQAASLTSGQWDLSEFDRLALTDASGLTLWSTPQQPEVLLGQPDPDPAVTAVLVSHHAQMLQVRLPGGAEAALANVAVPVRDATGQLAGVLTGDIDPADPALKLLPVRPIGDAIQVHLMNRDGWALAGNAQDDLDRQMDRAHALLLADLIQSQTSGYRVHDPPPIQMPDGRVVTVNSHIVAYAPVASLPDWGLVIEQPNDVVLASPRELQVRLALSGAAMLLIAVAFAWLDVRRVVRPLRQLTTSARRFAAGDLEEPINLQRSDELGVLAHAFETMRQRLRASLAEVSEWNRELERRVAARTSEVERRNRELANLNAIAETVSSTLDTAPMLERSLSRVLEITGADMGCFRLADHRTAKIRLPAGRGMPEDCSDEHAPCSACQSAGIRACVTVPLEAGQGTEGALFLASHEADYFDRINRATLSAIGRQVGMALINARLYESLRAREHERAELLQRIIAGQEEERRRLAQELHDQASQALASLQLGLDRLAAGVEDQDAARRIASDLRQVAEETLDSVHHLAVELRPSVLDDVGLVAALQRYLRDWAEHAHMDFDFMPVAVDGLRLVPAAETAVYRIVQAALTNISQHAEARGVSVILQRRGQNLIVVVEDDGRGFDPGAVRARPLEHRLGLAGMEERATLIGATLSVESTPGMGSSLILDVPLDVNVYEEEVGAGAASAAG